MTANPKELPILRIDDKWSVQYDPDRNDKPVAYMRYEEVIRLHSATNIEVAMFYRILELEELCRSEGVNL